MKRFLGFVSIALVLWTASRANAASITKVTNTAPAMPVTQLQGGPYDGQVLGLDNRDGTKSYLFDPNTNAWSDSPVNAQLPSGEYPVTMTDGTYVAIASGCGENSSPNVWDPVTMSFHTGSPGPYSSSLASGVTIAVWAESADSIAILTTDDCTGTPRFFAYSISTNTWTTRSLPPVPISSMLYGHTQPLPVASNSVSNSVLDQTMVVGGRTFFFATAGSYQSAYAYDPNTDTWATYANVLPTLIPGLGNQFGTIFQGSTKVVFVDALTKVVYLYDTSTPDVPARKLPNQPAPPLLLLLQLYAVGTQYFFHEGSKSYCFDLARTDMGMAPTPIIWDEATESFLQIPCSILPDNVAQQGFSRYTFQLDDGRFLSGYGFLYSSHQFTFPNWWVYDPAGETAFGESCACTNDCLSGVCALSTLDEAANTCVECVLDNNCVGNPNGPICNPQTHACGPECDGDFGSQTSLACTSPNQPICGTSGAAQGMCVECTSNQSCGATAPLCDPQTFRCVPACAACSFDGGGGSDGGGTTDKAEAGSDDNTGGSDNGTGGNAANHDVLASGGGCAAVPTEKPGTSTGALLVGMLATCLAFARRRVQQGKPPQDFTRWGKQ